MGVVSEEKSNERNGDKERLQKTLDFNVHYSDEDGKEKNSKYDDMIYSKVPDSYNAMFPVADGGEIKRGNMTRDNRTLCDSTDEENEETSHQQALAMQLRKREASKKMCDEWGKGEKRG